MRWWSSPGRAGLARWGGEALERARQWRAAGVSDREIGRRLGMAGTTAGRRLGPRGAEAAAPERQGEAAACRAAGQRGGGRRERPGLRG